ITGHSFHGKTWFALQLAWGMARGEAPWPGFAVDRPVPVLYHVPEMHEAWVRQYLDVIGVGESENFLLRPMETGVWPLDSARMLRASEDGYFHFFDTSGFFSQAEDNNAYGQS